MNAANQSQQTPQTAEALRAVSVALRPVHGALLDATRREYEQTHDKVKTPAALLALAMNDENFSWLRPLSGLMSRIDDLADESEIDPLEVLSLHAAIESWTLLSSAPAGGFQSRYVNFLQQRPDLVMAHAELRAAVKKLEAVAAPLAGPIFSTEDHSGRVAFA
jgi:hypothetical protein